MASECYKHPQGWIYNQAGIQVPKVLPTQNNSCWCSQSLRTISSDTWCCFLKTLIKTRKYLPNTTCLNWKLIEHL